MHLPTAREDPWGRGHFILFTLGGGLQDFTLLCRDQMLKCQMICWIRPEFSVGSGFPVASRQQQGRRRPPLKSGKA